MAPWTAERIPDLRGKTIIITGANSGLGFECALALARKGARVILACRRRERGEGALKEIKKAVPPAELDLIELDLASLGSIRTFAGTFAEQHDRLDGLMNNAGVMGIPRRLTEDGFEMQLGVNHLGHFALTGLLLPLLKKSPAGRVVIVSSRMHAEGAINWDDLMGEKVYAPWDAYRQSKLANLLFAFELQRRLEAEGSAAMAIAVHPGQAATNWHENFSGLRRGLMGFISRLFLQSAAMGALPLLYAAVDPEAKPGGYVGPDGDTKGYPVELRASEAAYDEADAKRLWDLSEALTGVSF